MIYTYLHCQSTRMGYEDPRKFLISSSHRAYWKQSELGVILKSINNYQGMPDQFIHFFSYESFDYLEINKIIERNKIRLLKMDLIPHILSNRVSCHLQAQHTFCQILHMQYITYINYLECQANTNVYFGSAVMGKQKFTQLLCRILGD